MIIFRSFPESFLIIIHMDWNKWSPAIRITSLYIVFGTLWIIWSDWLLTLWISEPALMRTAQTHKGWFFVLVTGVMLFFLIRNSIRQTEETRQAYTRQLQESERQLSTLMAGLPGMVFRCRNDKNWTMLFVSKGCLALTGYTEEELIHTHVLSYARIIHPEDRRLVLNLVNKNIDSKEHYNISYRIITKTGQVKWVRENAVGVYDDNDQLLYLEGLIIDITIEKESEQEIEKHLTELRRVNDELDRFSTSVSHDLRSPLLTIEGFISLIKQDLDDGHISGVRANIQRILNAIDKMHQLLEDLLKLSRLGRVVNPFSMISMDELINEVIEQLHGIISCEDCSIQIEPDMPFVYGDKTRVAVVVQNLIENAVKFRKPGQPLTILIGYRNSSEFPVFYVRDDGIGIDPAHHDHIFGLFNKLDSRAKGTGVGLALAERIIKFHGGTVWVESGGAGQGSTFFFSLPAQPPTSS